MKQLMHRPVLTLAFALALVGGATALSAVPTSAATLTQREFTMPAGPGVQTFQLGDNTVSIAFSQLTVSAAVASPDAYTVQHVSVTDSAPLGFHSTISGDWQYNGTYAYVWGAAPSCSSNLAVVLNCSNLNNGVSMPYPMVWIDEGYDVADGGSTYQIEIDLYGNGVHEVYVTGP